MTRVAVVDTGGANLGSVAVALQRLGAEVRVTRSAQALRRAARVVVPGVGAAAPAMARLRACGLDRVLATLSQPVLGICLGMQLLYEQSAEGEVECLGLLPGRVEALPATPAARSPHMGWNALEPCRGARLPDGVAPGAQVYFVHGYAAPVDGHCVAAATHGTRFAALVRRGNVHGAQFHPERSGAVGARILANFLAERRA